MSLLAVRRVFQLRGGGRGGRGLSGRSESHCKLQALAEVLRAEGLHALLVPSGDPHLGEYSAKRYDRRQFISGFTGSAGTAVIIQSGKGLLWTDGRYFEQAENELSSDWQLMKSGVEGVPSICDYFKSFQPGSIIAFDSTVHSAQEILEMKQCLVPNNVHLKSLMCNPVDEIWGKNMPPLPKSRVRIHPHEFAGLDASEKITQIRRDITDVVGQDQEFTLVMSELDEIAWTFNIRGEDVPHNPVTYAFALIATRDVKLFVDKSSLSVELVQYLESFDVTLHAYESFYEHLEFVSTQQDELRSMKVLVDQKTASYKIYCAVPEDVRYDITSPVPLLKACKNKSEEEGMRRCHRRDGAAVVSFLSWLTEFLSVDNTKTGSSQSISEVDIDAKLTQHRKLFSPESFICRSFDTIAGANGNGAIIHYRAVEEKCARLTCNDILLLDSGAQYIDGTTDVTRTIHLGKATTRQSDLYTRVLMGHIDLASAIFPAGTSGFALDSLARRHLWHVGLDYPHGTGHGVGAALCVHEGPQRIANKVTPQLSTSASCELRKGMIVSIEPGYYETNSFGIRLENLYIVADAPMQDGASSSHIYYQFLPLTFIPFQRTLVNSKLLSTQQLDWLNKYHSDVKREITPLMKYASEVCWLEDACKIISK